MKKIGREVVPAGHSAVESLLRGLFPTTPPSTHLTTDEDTGMAIFLSLFLIKKHLIGFIVVQAGKHKGQHRQLLSTSLLLLVVVVVVMVVF